jgi:hypothetical protein
VTALGGSPSSHGPIEGEIIQFDSLELLEAATVEEVQGKIVFLSTRMSRTREGSDYGKAVINRSRGPFVASGKGALALLIRSVGTDSDRLPHTGMISGAGAVDDGAGVAIVLAAARMVADLPERPRHATRVVLYANEEQGVYGGKAYAKLHASDLNEHIIGAESDLGADRIYRFKTRVLPQSEPVIAQLAGYLENLEIEYEHVGSAGGGADVGQMRKLGLPVIDLNQDASRYFDLHHTANDTLDKVNPEHLRQNLAAWVTLAYVTANSTVSFGPVEPSE